MYRNLSRELAWPQVGLRPSSGANAEAPDRATSAQTRKRDHSHEKHHKHHHAKHRRPQAAASAARWQAGGGLELCARVPSAVALVAPVLPPSAARAVPTPASVLPSCGAPARDSKQRKVMQRVDIGRANKTQRT
jgi:hypothetical protein